MRKVACYWFLVAGIFVISSCKSGRREYVVGTGERIHHDDFEYSVPDYMITRFLKTGTDTVRAKGMFYIVTFRVENKALRVSHEWDNSIAYITDEKAGKFYNQPDIQKIYNQVRPFGLKDKYITPAGRTDSTCLVFDLPFIVTMPYLKVTGSTLMGDLFDGALFRRVRVKLF